MVFRRAILPAVLSWADKPVMIGNLLEHIPNSLPMLHSLYHLYGRTIVILFPLLVNLYRFLEVVDHITCRRGRMHHVLPVVDDALRDVGRVYHRPLCACPARKEQAEADNHCNSCSHFTLDLAVVYFFTLSGSPVAALPSRSPR